MATINEELNYLEETKSLIKQAIINKGQDITDQDSFRSYVNKIDDISTMNAQTKIVNPTTNTQNIEPDEGFNALNKVIVSGVTNTIDNNIQANNIKTGVTILGVTGTLEEGIDTSDANAVASNIEIGKTAYVNGTKITGSLNVVDNQGHSVDNTDPTDVILNWDMGTALLLQSTYDRQNPVIIKPNDPFYLAANKSTLAGIINLTADKIKLGETILGITGTYSDAMKSYNSETAMNNDIANIQEGEVVKVVNQGITTYYIKEISTTTEYQAVDLSQYEEGDTISIKNMKLNSTVTLPTEVGRLDGREFTLSYNNIKVLECNITSQISIDFAGVTVNGTDIYTFIDNNPTFSLADNDLQAINSSEIWQSNNQLTISGSKFSDYTGILLEPVEIPIGVMKKLVKESETISPQEYEENVDLANDILGEEE